ncbi:hypothetical protein [Qipengyuania sphaerica]|uniref:hypothetical protein n=1 Tax=Qipengyuania sphaerica TaxID=2867243 RepID=UPI001C88C500|nr:hypothetical protein [Qipengyuania sphaerica]MBX7541593.1 hypothetical protein [Qipengyuania sphaerica]
MAKPDSIKKFDLLYIGSVVVGLLGIVFGWDMMMDQMNAEMATQGIEADSGIGSGAIIAGVVFGVGISMALWFLISILRIEFVKWILILFVLWSIFGIFVGLSTTGFDMMQITGIVSTIMSIAAIYMLFQPDAKEWFAAKRGA